MVTLLIFVVFFLGCGVLWWTSPYLGVGVFLVGLAFAAYLAELTGEVTDAISKKK